MMDYRTFEKPEQVVESLAHSLVEYSKQDQPVHISLSGGSTPKLLFKVLAQAPFATSITWTNLHFWWGDERCVAPDDAESNFGEAQALLFSKVALPTENIHRILGEDAPEQEVIRFAQEMQTVIPAHNGLPCFDWILLGMGGDGHTASLFPGQTDYNDENIAIIAQHPESGQYRISKTARLLANAKRISYLVLGAGKAEVIKQIHDNDDAALAYPAAQVKANQGSTEWILDAAAARLINS
ncbi:6-phosphogluconolactonase [Moritella sp. F3]|uniref:6-phosphogluconolactonase n=1 Tax=Moritella sp. F3 TaxID=2718882 RepID=UPI001A1A663F|nr:6-phosphogluconolactonase [Moritella sp. F3]GIC78178.1 6-phosphogluconolactonase [Moritella sp. F1]GIC81178.1 6-phosphogluconolactonase [Moritella sp. F3]